MSVLNEQTLPFGAYVKIIDKELKTYNQIGIARKPIGLYDLIIPNEETPEFLKDLHPEDIDNLLLQEVIKFSEEEEKELYGLLWDMQENIYAEEIPCILTRENSKVEGCTLKKVKMAYEVKPEDFSSTYVGKTFMGFRDTQILTIGQVEYLGYTVFNKEFRKKVDKEAEKKKKLTRFLFSLPFVMDIWFRRQLKLTPEKLYKATEDIFKFKKRKQEFEEFMKK